MKNKIFSMAILATGALTFASCADQLDIPQKGVIPMEEYYESEDEVTAALNNAYVNFMGNVFGRQPDLGGPGIYTPLKIITNIPGDDLYYASGNYGDHEFSGEINEFRYTTNSEPVKFQYAGLYQAIYTSNLVINNFDKASNAIAKKSIAEARVLRAYCYYLLANLWGNAPLVENTLSADALPVVCAETPEEGRKLLLNFVAKECEAAVENLSERADKTDKNGCVIVSKGFANALAGKAWLQLNEYDKAKADLKKVIDSGKYALVPTDKWSENFHIEGDCNEEKVFELNLEYNTGVSGWGGMIQRSSWMEANAWNWRAGNFKVNPAYVYCGIDGWGGLGVKQAFGDEFFANDGHSVRFDESLVNVHDAIFGHAMTYASDALNKMSEAELLASDEVGISDATQGLYGNSFWLQKKWLMRANDTDGNKYGTNIRLNNYVVLRYAEVLLDYAEACVQSGDVASAKTYINMIQQRAGSKTISGTVDFETVKKERHYELFLENSRWIDIMRWNDAKAIAEIEKNGTDVPHVYDKMFREPKSGEKVTWHSDGRLYTVATQAAKDAGIEVGFKKGKHEFFPFPENVIMKNPKLKQHNGW